MQVGGVLKADNRRDTFERESAAQYGLLGHLSGRQDQHLQARHTLLQVCRAAL